MQGSEIILTDVQVVLLSMSAESGYLFFNKILMVIAIVRVVPLIANSKLILGREGMLKDLI